MLTQNRQYLILNRAPIRCNSIFLLCCPLSILPRRGQEVISDNVFCTGASHESQTSLWWEVQPKLWMKWQFQTVFKSEIRMDEFMFLWMGVIIPSPLNISYISVHTPTHPAYTLISNAFFTSINSSILFFKLTSGLAVSWFWPLRGMRKSSWNKRE